MQLRLPSLIAFLVFSTSSDDIAEMVINTGSAPAPIAQSIDNSTNVSATEGRTLGLVTPLIGGVFNLLFGSGGYPEGDGDYIKPCGQCGGTQYFGSNNGYYGFYSHSRNIKYIDNYNGTYTLYIYDLYGDNYGSTLAVTCPSNAFRFNQYSQGYYCQINQNFKCYSKII